MAVGRRERSDDRSAASYAAMPEHYRGQQGLLFGDEPDTLRADVGYRGPTACAAAGITYRQLDYWARTALVEPSVRPDRDLAAADPGRGAAPAGSRR